MRIGWNINGANPGDWPAIVEWHRVNKPAWALVMDDTGKAAELKAASPGTNVIIRTYQNTGHENTYNMLTPDAFIRLAIQQKANRDLWVQVGNESGFSDELLIWTAHVIEKAAAYNQGNNHPLKLVILNHAVGTPQPNDWKRAAARRILTLASKYRDWVVIGLHEYFNIVPTSGFRGGNPQWIQPQDWPQEPRNVGALWHCGRFEFALQACRENGIVPYPRFVLTEHGTDDVSDIKQWVESFGQGSGRGWKHAAKLWALPSFYPGKPKEEVFAGMLRYLDEHLYRNSPVEGQLVFTLSKSPDWAAFDAAEMLEHIKAEEAPTEPPALPGAGIPTTLKNTSEYYRGVRAAPGVESKLIYLIAPGITFAAYLDTVKLTGDNMRWTWVTVAGVNGWTANVHEWTNGQLPPVNDNSEGNDTPVVIVPEHPGMAVIGTNTFQLAIVVRNKPDGVQLGSIAPKAQYTYYPGTAVTLDTGYTWVFVQVGSTLGGWCRTDALGVDISNEDTTGGDPVPDTTEKISQLEARITALETAMKNAGIIFANVNGKEL